MKYLPASLLLLIAISCTKLVEIDIPIQEDEYVILAYAQENTNVQVLISRTYPITEYVSERENEIEKVTNAEVLLFVNNDYTESLGTTGEFYLSEYTVKANDSLDLQIVLPNDTLIAGVRVPANTPINSYSYSKDAFIDSEGDYWDIVHFEFDDKPLAKNFYEIYVKHTIQNEEYIYTEKTSIYESNDPILNNEDLIDYEPESMLISDALFNGKTANIYFPTYMPYLSSDETLLKSEFYLIAVSESYYLYQKSLYKHIYLQYSSSIWESMSEPIAIYSSIENAKGFFCAYSISSQPLTISE